MYGRVGRYTEKEFFKGFLGTWFHISRTEIFEEFPRMPEYLMDFYATCRQSVSPFIVLSYSTGASARAQFFYTSRNGNLDDGR